MKKNKLKLKVVKFLFSVKLVKSLGNYYIKSFGIF